MKVTRSDFVCDYCTKQTLEREAFPYETGWNFLYALNWQTLKPKQSSGKDKIKRYVVQDKHFCSKECIINWLTNHIKNSGSG